MKEREREKELSTWHTQYSLSDSAWELNLFDGGIRNKRKKNIDYEEIGISNTNSYTRI